MCKRLLCFVLVEVVEVLLVPGVICERQRAEAKGRDAARASME